MARVSWKILQVRATEILKKYASTTPRDPRLLEEANRLINEAVKAQDNDGPRH